MHQLDIFGVDECIKITDLSKNSFRVIYYVLKNNTRDTVRPIVPVGIPPTGWLAAIFLLWEKPTPVLFIGGTIIIVGGILIVFTKNKKDGVTKWK